MTCPACGHYWAWHGESGCRVTTSATNCTCTESETTMTDKTPPCVIGPADWISDRRALLEAATGPEWETYEYDDISLGQKVVAVRTIKRSGGNTPVCSTGYSAWPESRPDAALIADARTSLPKALDALEAVLELHVEGMCSGGYGCEVCEENFPCRTVAAITAALGVES